MGEYSPKKSLSCYPRVFENSYFAVRHNGQFLGKFAKPLERGVKCYENRGEKLIYKKYAKFRMNFVQKS